VFDDGSPPTVTATLQSLYRAGYTADFELVDGGLRVDGGSVCTIDEAVVEHFYRFEGPSDPGDQMIVFALLDPNSGVRGTLAAAYGPTADPVLYEHLTVLRQRLG
jgi:DNA-binding transcriptional ArsR family regulator